jgi:mono/diheme cytochrome c family protein
LAFPLFLLAVSAWVMANSVSREQGSAAADPERVRMLKVYQEHCQSCHGKEGRSKFPELNLADQEWSYGKGLDDIGENIREGIKGTSMMPFKYKLSEQEISSLAKYVASLHEDSR